MKAVKENKIYFQLWMESVNLDNSFDMFISSVENGEFLTILNWLESVVFDFDDLPDGTHLNSNTGQLKGAIQMFDIINTIEYGNGLRTPKEDFRLDNSTDIIKDWAAEPYTYALDEDGESYVYDEDGTTKIIALKEF